MVPDVVTSDIVGTTVCTHRDGLIAEVFGISTASAFNIDLGMLLCHWGLVHHGRFCCGFHEDDILLRPTRIFLEVRSVKPQFAAHECYWIAYKL